MFKTTEEVIDNIEVIIAQALNVAENRHFGLGIVRVYYLGGTLCIDIHDKSKMAFVVMVNINGEEFNVIDSLNNGKETQRILPIKALKIAFIIYEKTKGKTEYFNECFNNSCLRHFSNPLEIKSNNKNK